MSKEIQERAKFNKIRYANCWEDPELLLEVFDSGKKILSIASAGDNSLSLRIFRKIDIKYIKKMNLCKLYFINNGANQKICNEIFGL